MLGTLNSYRCRREAGTGVWGLREYGVRNTVYAKKYPYTLYPIPYTGLRH